ncbi:helix-turn-helix domain-containing protein [Granulosicoccus sp.]|nr:helix-turn-helix domain-containing protein [Granulosicoccus sp.]MDB4222864.1 helix-turn-helix domain-containing protein [Granulosicoccus sp.]
MSRRITPQLSPNSPPFRVVFLLQRHFSLLAFTAAADALTTANLVIGEKRFEFQTLSLQEERIISDLGIPISCDQTMSVESSYASNAQQNLLLNSDLLIVCGGLRCNLDQNESVSTFLQRADQKKVMLGGLWNGIIGVAHAGLMNGHAAALHPANHDMATEHFPDLLVRQDSVVIDRNRVSAAGPNSAFDLMLLLIQRHDCLDTVQSIRQILKADTGSAENVESALQRDDERWFPDNLQNALQLMRSNLDDPVDKDVLAQHMNTSTRAMERLFQRHLSTSPARHYLQLRLQSAHELLLHTDKTIGEISDSCGFVSSSHFSRTFSQRYGFAPSMLRKSVNRVLDA